MVNYLVAYYGDPCRGCGFAFSSDDENARRIIAGAPDRFDALLEGRDGTEQLPDLSWNASAYTAHCADNTRIWSERAVAAALGAAGPVTPYDEDSLGEARGYARLPLEGLLWSLRRAVGDWQAAEALAWPLGFELLHPEQGVLPAPLVLRIVAHELHRHEGDIARILRA